MSRSTEKHAERAGAGEAPARGRGRPRSAEAEHAILEATLKLLSEQGVAGLTIEGVAAEAGVGKTTIYRRWATKTDLIIAAVEQLAPPAGVEFPDTGSFVGDLELLAQGQRARTAGTRLLNVAPRVLAEAADDPELHSGFSEAVIEPLRRIIALIVERGQARGEVRADLDAGALVDLLHAIPIYRLLLGAGDPSFIDEIGQRYIPLLLEGVSSSSAGPGSARRRSSGSSRAKRARSA
ncbi:MAG TPA: TetR/AcrR family transcriptional regulator [Thermoleophilaceae bacterium]|nr:TetR/AcrR family transcriptional regulator [Thermoleophilaceae bacterium]